MKGTDPRVLYKLRYRARTHKAFPATKLQAKLENSPGLFKVLMTKIFFLLVLPTQSAKSTMLGTVALNMMMLT